MIQVRRERLEALPGANRLPGRRVNDLNNRSVAGKKSSNGKKTTIWMNEWKDTKKRDIKNMTSGCRKT